MGEARDKRRDRNGREFRKSERRIEGSQPMNGRIYRMLAVILLGMGAVAVSGCETPSGQTEKEEQRSGDEGETDEREGEEGDEEPLPDPVDDLGAKLEKPSRIILMVGDGMGAGQITAAMHAANRPLHLQTMSKLNFLTTHSYEYVTTDSAAAATAFASGKKTHYEGLSVRPGTEESREEASKFQLGTVVERAEKRGWRTGLVATSEIVHATPAAFAAHRAGRHSYEDIARDMAGSGVDVLLGGGTKYFQDRKDGADLFREMKENGYEIETSADGIREASEETDQLVGLYEPDALPALQDEEREMSLAEMTRRAFRVLDRGNPKGWFLMVEGSQIDWEGHELDGPGTVSETLSYDRAVGEALDYAEGREDTLVVSVADHETGGLSVVEPEATKAAVDQQGGPGAVRQKLAYPGGKVTSPNPLATVKRGRETGSEGPNVDDRFGLPDEVSGAIQMVWGHLSQASRPLSDGPGSFWGTHTPELVPMYVEGEGASYVASVLDNAQLGERLTRLVSDEPIRVRSDSEDGERVEEPSDQVIVYLGEGLDLAAWSASTYSRKHMATRSARVRGMMVPETSTGQVVPSRRQAIRALLGAGGSEEAATAVGRAAAGETDVGLVTTAPVDGAQVKQIAGMSAEDDAAALFGERGLFDRVIGAPPRDRGRRDDFEMGLDGAATSYRTVEYREFGGEQESGMRSGATLRGAVNQMLDETRGLDRKSLIVVYDARPGRLQDERERGKGLPQAVSAFDAAVSRGLEEVAARAGEVTVAVTAPRARTLSVLDNHYGFTKETACGVARRCGGTYKLKEIPIPGGVQQTRAGWADRALQGEYAPPTLFLQYAWPAQVAEGEAGEIASANLVPMFASGPGAEGLWGTQPQGALGDMLNGWIGGRGR